MSIVDFVRHECQINNTSVFVHANGIASDILCFLKECQNVPTPQWVEYPYSAGARQCKVVPLDIWRKLSCDFSDEIYQIKSKRHLDEVIQFPPKYLHKDKSSYETISSMFVNCMETENTAGLVVVGYDVKKHLQILGYLVKDLDAARLQLPEDHRNHILLYYPSLNVVLHVRVTEDTGLEAIQIAQAECNEDIKAFALIYDSVLKENEMILCGITAAPNLDLQQEEIISFLCQTCISSNLILTKQELSDLGSLQAWWNNKFKQEIEDMVKKYDLFQKNKLSSKDLFSNVAGQILAVMSTIFIRLPSLFGNVHQKVSTVLLNKKQQNAIYHPSKKKIIRGAYGTGKSIVGREIFSSICLTGKTRTFVFFICFDPWCLMDYCLRKDLGDIQSKVHFDIVNICDIVEQYKLNNVPTISFLLKYLCDKKRKEYDEIHFVIDEVDGENITLQESNTLKDLFQNHDILKDSIVALIIQSMEKRRSFNVFGSDPKQQDANCFVETGMQLLQLDRSMRTTLQINNVSNVIQIEVSKKPNEYHHAAEQTQIEVSKKPNEYHYGEEQTQIEVSKKPNEYLKGAEQIKQEISTTMPMLDITGNADTRVQIKQKKNSEDSTVSTEPLYAEENVTAQVQVVTQDIKLDEQVHKDETKHNELGVAEIEPTQDIDVLAKNTDAARKANSLIKTVTNFVYNEKCAMGHSINGPKPRFIFLNNQYTEHRLPFVSKILAAFLDDMIMSKLITLRVVICSDNDGLKLLERVLNILKIDCVPYTPWTFQTLSTRVERDQMMKKFESNPKCVLLTDNRGFRGMEEEDVLILLEKSEYYQRQALPESICRATSKLTLVLFDKLRDVDVDNLPTLRKLIENKLDTTLAEKIDLCVEEDQRNKNLIRQEGTTYYVNIASDDFEKLDNKVKNSNTFIHTDQEKKQLSKESYLR